MTSEARSNVGVGISAAVAQTGLSADTLRFYERIGLLGPVARNAGGQRRYHPRDLERLRFVKRAQAMDFSLEEIGQLLVLRDQPDDVRADVRALTERKLAAIDRRIDSLTRLRDELTDLIRRCHASEQACPIIGHMNGRQE